MKKILIICFLIFSYFSAFSQLRKKNEIEITFRIKDFEGNPIQNAHITVETIDKRENSRNGKYKHRESVENYDSNKESIFKIILSKSKFADRKVLISVLDMKNLAPYFKFYKKEFDKLTDEQIINVQMEVDEIAYKNRTSEIIFRGKDISSLNPSFENSFNDIIKSNFNVEIYTEDLERLIIDTAIISFTIDKNCNIIDRRIQRKISGLRTDLENAIMNSLELRLKEINEKDFGCKETEVNELKIYWNQN